LILAIKIVDSLSEAIAHITAMVPDIPTRSPQKTPAAATFLAQVNAAGCTTTAQLAFLMASATGLGQKSGLVPAAAWSRWFRRAGDLQYQLTGDGHIAATYLGQMLNLYS